MDNRTDAYHSQLENLLAQQLRRIRRRFLIHGVAAVLAILALLTAVYFPLDRYLDLPRGVRVVLSLAALAYLGHVAWRFLLYPLRRELTRRDVAVAIERRFPELQQKLISAFQLGASLHDDGARRNQSGAMIEQLVAEAAEHADRIPHQQLLNPRATGKLWGLSAVLFLTLGSLASTAPETARTFLQRILGMSSDYPRRTHLVLESPGAETVNRPEYRVSRQGDVIQVVLAEGADLPVLVRADGEVPREVELVVEGGRGLAPRISMAPRGEGRFRHSFRRVSEPFSFFAVGGDDDRGRPTVQVEIIRPPQVQALRAMVEYPAYTRKEPSVQEGSSLQALIGSRLELAVEATTEVTEARIKFLESGQVLELDKRMVRDDAGERPVYSGSITVTQADRFQVELMGTEGLRNPHPGTYQIFALPDHPPVARLLSPGDDNLNVCLPDALVPVRITAKDDFGLIHMGLSMQGDAKFEPLVSEVFQDAGEGPPRLSSTSLKLLDLTQEGYKDRAGVGQTLVFSAKVRDNREPEAGEKEIGPRQLHVIGETDLMRRVSAHFRRIREDVDQNLNLLRDRRERLQDAIDELQGGASLRDQMLAITSVEVGQGRIQTSSRRVHTELMRAFDFHLFNRLETSKHALTVLEMYQETYGQSQEAKRFLPAFYREVAKARQEGRLGAMDKALDPILQMLGAADRIAWELCPASVEDLSRSRVAPDKAVAAEALGRVSQNQKAMLEEFEFLLSRLDAWNEFQDVITNTRALRDAQRELRERNEALQGGSKK